MAGSWYVSKGGGANFLCMHPDPQYPDGYSDKNGNGARLYGVEYVSNGILDKSNHEDAACVLCEHNTAKSVYVQWGRSKCSHGHITQYSGMIMATRSTHHKSENICVDLELAAHSTSIAYKGDSGRLYTTEFASDRKGSQYQMYVKNRELSCAVCSPPEYVAAPTCRDKAGWTDMYGDDCSASFYSTDCMPEETVPHANKSGVSAKDACCACGGGDRNIEVPRPPPGA